MVCKLYKLCLLLHQQVILMSTPLPTIAISRRLKILNGYIIAGLIVQHKLW